MRKSILNRYVSPVGGDNIVSSHEHGRLSIDEAVGRPSVIVKPRMDQGNTDNQRNGIHLKRPTNYEVCTSLFETNLIKRAKNAESLTDVTRHGNRLTSINSLPQDDMGSNVASANRRKSPSKPRKQRNKPRNKNGAISKTPNGRTLMSSSDTGVTRGILCNGKEASRKSTPLPKSKSIPPPPPKGRCANPFSIEETGDCSDSHEKSYQDNFMSILDFKVSQAKHRNNLSTNVQVLTLQTEVGRGRDLPKVGNYEDISDDELIYDNSTSLNLNSYKNSATEGPCQNSENAIAVTKTGNCESIPNGARKNIQIQPCDIGKSNGTVNVHQIGAITDCPNSLTPTIMKQVQNMPSVDFVSPNVAVDKHIGRNQTNGTMNMTSTPDHSTHTFATDYLMRLNAFGNPYSERRNFKPLASNIGIHSSDSGSYRTDWFRGGFTPVITKDQLRDNTTYQIVTNQFADMNNTRGGRGQSRRGGRGQSARGRSGRSSGRCASRARRGQSSGGVTFMSGRGQSVRRGKACVSRGHSVDTGASTGSESGRNQCRGGGIGRSGDMSASTGSESGRNQCRGGGIERSGDMSASTGSESGRNQCRGGGIGRSGYRGASTNDMSQPLVMDVSFGDTGRQGDMGAPNHEQTSSTYNSTPQSEHNSSINTTSQTENDYSLNISELNNGMTMVTESIPQLTNTFSPHSGKHQERNTLDANNRQSNNVKDSGVTLHNEMSSVDKTLIENSILQNTAPSLRSQNSISQNDDSVLDKNPSQTDETQQSKDDRLNPNITIFNGAMQIEGNTEVRRRMQEAGAMDNISKILYQRTRNVCEDTHETVLSCQTETYPQIRDALLSKGNFNVLVNPMPLEAGDNSAKGASTCQKRKRKRKDTANAKDNDTSKKGKKMAIERCVPRNNDVFPDPITCTSGKNVLSPIYASSAVEMNSQVTEENVSLTKPKNREKKTKKTSARQNADDAPLLRLHEMILQPLDEIYKNFAILNRQKKESKIKPAPKVKENRIKSQSQSNSTAIEVQGSIPVQTSDTQQTVTISIPVTNGDNNVQLSKSGIQQTTSIVNKNCTLSQPKVGHDEKDSTCDITKNVSDERNRRKQLSEVGKVVTSPTPRIKQKGRQSKSMQSYTPGDKRRVRKTIMVSKHVTPPMPENEQNKQDAILGMTLTIPCVESTLEVMEKTTGATNVDRRNEPEPVPEIAGQKTIKTALEIVENATPNPVVVQNTAKDNVCQRQNPFPVAISISETSKRMYEQATWHGSETLDAQPSLNVTNIASKHITSKKTTTLSPESGAPMQESFTIMMENRNELSSIPSSASTTSENSNSGTPPEVLPSDGITHDNVAVIEDPKIDNEDAVTDNLMLLSIVASSVQRNDIEGKNSATVATNCNSDVCTMATTRDDSAKSTTTVSSEDEATVSKRKIMGKSEGMCSDILPNATNQCEGGIANIHTMLETGKKEGNVAAFPIGIYPATESEIPAHSDLGMNSSSTTPGHDDEAETEGEATDESKMHAIAHSKDPDSLDETQECQKRVIKPTPEDVAEEAAFENTNNDTVIDEDDDDSIINEGDTEQNANLGKILSISQESNMQMTKVADHNHQNELSVTSAKERSKHTGKELALSKEAVDTNGHQKHQGVVVKSLAPITTNNDANNSIERRRKQDDLELIGYLSKLFGKTEIVRNDKQRQNNGILKVMKLCLRDCRLDSKHSAMERCTRSSDGREPNGFKKHFKHRETIEAPMNRSIRDPNQNISQYKLQEKKHLLETEKQTCNMHEPNTTQSDCQSCETMLDSKGIEINPVHNNTFLERLRQHLLSSGIKPMSYTDKAPISDSDQHHDPIEDSQIKHVISKTTYEAHATDCNQHNINTSEINNKHNKEINTSTDVKGSSHAVGDPNLVNGLSLKRRPRSESVEQGVKSNEVLATDSNKTQNAGEPKDCTQETDTMTLSLSEHVKQGQTTDETIQEQGLGCHSESRREENEDNGSKDVVSDTNRSRRNGAVTRDDDILIDRVVSLRTGTSTTHPGLSGDHHYDDREVNCIDSKERVSLYSLFNGLGQQDSVSSKHRNGSETNGSSLMVSKREQDRRVKLDFGKLAGLKGLMQRKTTDRHTQNSSLQEPLTNRDGDVTVIKAINIEPKGGQKRRSVIGQKLKGLAGTGQIRHCLHNKGQTTAAYGRTSQNGGIIERTLAINKQSKKSVLTITILENRSREDKQKESDNILKEDERKK